MADEHEEWLRVTSPGGSSWLLPAGEPIQGNEIQAEIEASEELPPWLRAAEAGLHGSNNASAGEPASAFQTADTVQAQAQPPEATATSDLAVLARSD